MIGVGAHKFIKEFLVESPLIICISLVVGGVILLFVDRMKYRPRYLDVMDTPPLAAMIIGFVQCLAMIPGVSRSGSTIVGGMLLSADKRTAAEFSFFLAMPTMTGAFAYDLYKNWSILTPDDISHIVLGFIAAFVTGVIVVRYMLDFISRRRLSFFGWWRLLVGGIGLGAIAVLHRLISIDAKYYAACDVTGFISIPRRPSASLALRRPSSVAESRTRREMRASALR
jgi:undecaprenyl-diphosphatase